MNRMNTWSRRGIRFVEAVLLFIAIYIISSSVSFFLKEVSTMQDLKKSAKGLFTSVAQADVPGDGIQGAESGSGCCESGGGGSCS